MNLQGRSSNEDLKNERFESVPNFISYEKTRVHMLRKISTKLSNDSIKALRSTRFLRYEKTFYKVEHDLNNHWQWDLYLQRNFPKGFKRWRNMLPTLGCFVPISCVLGPSGLSSANWFQTFNESFWAARASASRVGSHNNVVSASSEVTM